MIRIKDLTIPIKECFQRGTNLDQQGRSKYHLDHMFSIFEEFKQGVDLCIVGHVRNLK
jgi:hypothetical protein